MSERHIIASTAPQGPHAFFENEQTTAILNLAIPQGHWSGWSCAVTHNGESRILCGGKHASPKFTHSRYPVTEKSMWDIASLTKVIVSILTLYSVKVGMCRLDSRIKKYVPTLRPNGDCPTVRDMLAFGVTFDLMHLSSPYTHVSPEDLWKEIVSARIKVSGFKYSNYAPFILARMLERQFGVTIEALAKKVIFDPLGMSDITFRSSDVMPDRMVVGEAPNDKPVMDVQDELSRAMYPKFSGAAGIFSSIGDLLKIAQMLLYPSRARDGIISPEHVALLGTNQIRPGMGNTASGLGFGLVSELMKDFNVPKSVQKNPGLIDGAFFRTSFGGSMMAVFPRQNSALVLCTNYVHPRRKTPSMMAKIRHAIIASAIFGEFVPEGQGLVRPAYGD